MSIQAETTAEQITDFLEIQSSYAPSFNSLDDAPILNTVSEKYPDFVPGKDDKVLRKVFLDMLENSDFMAWLLEYYSMGIETFIEIVYRSYGEIFNSAIFLKKVRKIVSEKGYMRAKDL